MGLERMILNGKDIQQEALKDIVDALRLRGFKKQVGEMEVDVFTEIVAQSWNYYNKYVGILGLVKRDEEET